MIVLISSKQSILLLQFLLVILQFPAPTEQQQQQRHVSSGITGGVLSDSPWSGMHLSHRTRMHNLIQSLMKTTPSPCRLLQDLPKTLHGPEGIFLLIRHHRRQCLHPTRHLHVRLGMPEIRRKTSRHVRRWVHVWQLLWGIE